MLSLKLLIALHSLMTEKEETFVFEIHKSIQGRKSVGKGITVTYYHIENPPHETFDKDRGMIVLYQFLPSSIPF